MKYLRSATKEVLRRVAELGGKPVEFLRDDKLPMLATLQTARDGAPYHVLRYAPSDEPLDYVICYQAGFLLRLFENKPAERFDFMPAADAGTRVAPLVSAAAQLSPAEREAVPEFAGFVARWALMNLRSYPIGMRIDRWIARECPELSDLQAASLAQQQQQNADLLSFRRGKLTIPTTLMGGVAAYALFCEQLTSSSRHRSPFSVPFAASGLLPRAQELLAVWDCVPSGPKHDCELVDAWAQTDGLAGWYSWTPYRP